MKRMRTVVAVLVGAIALTGLERPTEAQSAAQAAKAAVAAELTATVLQKGTANVIVQLPLATGFAPERGMSIDRIMSQRSAIATARAALQADLVGWGATEYAAWDTLPYVALKVDLPALERLAASPLVASMQEDRLSDPALASSTALIGSDITVASGFRGDNWAVVILDTGIDTDHPFFSGRVVDQHCFSNGGGGGVTLCPGGGATQHGPGAAEVTDGAGNPIAACDDGSLNQICDHGVHVAGIAAGEDPPVNSQGFNGVAPGAFIIPIQVFTRFNAAADCAPNAPPCVKSYSSDQISALNYVNTTLVPLWDIASINMSLGGGQSNVACDGDALKAPIDALLANGVATVIAAGNDGWTDTISSPGCISTAVTVGGVTDGDAVIFNMGSVVDILAPGLSVVSSVPDDTFGNKSGTSMATPHVTGAFAVIRAIVGAGPSVADVLTLLQNSGPLITDTRAANNPGGAGSGTLTGHVKPRLQLDVAVAELVPADVRVLKDCKPDNPLFAGQTATCTIFVDNLGDGPAINVEMVDEHLSNGTFSIGAVQTSAGTCTATPNPQNGAGTVTCELGNMAAGERITIEVPITANSPQDVSDVATVTSDSDDPDDGNNVATDVLTFQAAADLGITKTDTPDPVTAGTDLTYVITATNDGPSVATNVVVQDFLPIEVNVVSATPSQGSCSGTTVPGDPAQPLTCNFGALADNGAASVTVVVRVKPNTPNGAILINNASVHSDVADPDNGDNIVTSSTTVRTQADLEITKTSDKAVYKPSSIVTYTLTVRNIGPSDALAVVVTDNLPDTPQAIYQSDTGGCTKSALTLTCELGYMAVGEVKSFNIYLLVRGSRGEVTNTASVASTGVTPTFDPALANNTSVRVVTVGK